MPINLPGSITIGPPVTPSIAMAPPSSGVVVVPVQGPPGPQGPQGPPGDTGSALGFATSVTNQSLVQMIHNLPFKPAGILCLDTNTPALTVEYATVSHPSAGITEITFGFPFTGQIFLS